MSGWVDATRVSTGPVSPTERVVLVRYWAGARAAAGVETESVEAGDVPGILARLAAAHDGLATVLPACTILVDGVAASSDTVVEPGSVLEVLPPFAGG